MSLNRSGEAATSGVLSTDECDYFTEWEEEEAAAPDDFCYETTEEIMDQNRRSAQARAATREVRQLESATWDQLLKTLRCMEHLFALHRGHGLPTI